MNDFTNVCLIIAVGACTLLILVGCVFAVWLVIDTMRNR